MWKRLAAAVRHAFALPKDTPLTPEQASLLDRIAAVIVTRQMQTPAVLALESSRPLGTLAANATHTLAPLLRGIVPAADLQAATQLMQHPGAIDRLIDRIHALPTDAASTASSAESPDAAPRS